MAEWLRRLTRNQMGSSRVGSNPTRSEENSFPLYFFFVSVPIRHLIMADFLAAMAEWLRRLTRNQMGSSRVGSNPTCSVNWYMELKQLQTIMSQKEPHFYRYAAMAEWLRRLTRNQMGSSRVGSNPTRSDTSVCVVIVWLFSRIVG